MVSIEARSSTVPPELRAKDSHQVVGQGKLDQAKGVCHEAMTRQAAGFQRVLELVDEAFRRAPVAGELEHGIGPHPVVIVLILVSADRAEDALAKEGQHVQFGPVLPARIVDQGSSLGEPAYLSLASSQRTASTPASEEICVV
jgi:hypothetical protein